MTKRELKKSMKKLMLISAYEDTFALYCEDSNGDFVPTQHWSACWEEIKKEFSLKQGSKRRRAFCFALSNLVGYGPGL